MKYQAEICRDDIEFDSLSIESDSLSIEFDSLSIEPDSLSIEFYPDPFIYC